MQLARESACSFHVDVSEGFPLLLLLLLLLLWLLLLLLLVVDALLYKIKTATADTEGLLID
jgi:hypothetical protein